MVIRIDTGEFFENMSSYSSFDQNCTETADVPPKPPTQKVKGVFVRISVKKKEKEKILPNKNCS
jgi:hypothetical protein